MAAAASKPPEPPPCAGCRCLILDFDSTISTPTYLQRAQSWAVADNVRLFESMTDAEVLANFGGAARIAQLDSLLSGLEAAGVHLYIVSIGFKAAIVPHLRVANLLRFFPEDRIYGQDCAELRETSFVKAMLIGKIMRAQGWQAQDVLFVDDTLSHIERAKATCRTLLVSKESKASVGGMAAAELEEIRRVVMGT